MFKKDFLIFAVLPQILSFSFGEEPANWGEVVTAVCTIVKGDLPIVISWSFNGQTLDAENNKGIVIANTNSRVSLMTIEAASASHVGEYTCTAENAAGSTSYTTTLAVNGDFTIIQIDA